MQAPRRLLPAVACAAVLGAASLLAQDSPAPRVGGNSTFDTAPNTGSSDTSFARRPLSGLATVPEDFFVLKLAPGFLLHMQVYDVPEFTTDLRVDAAGNVSIPTLGSVHVAGDSITEAQTTIADRLRSGQILRNPEVNLTVEQYAGQTVSIIGEVHTPGRIELLAPRSLPDVLALAGGETQYAGNTIDIRRRVNGAEEVLHVPYRQNHAAPDVAPAAPGQQATLDPQNLQVLPGDILTVRRAGIVYVLGGVNRPGGYIMQEDGLLSIPEAIALAAGTTLTASIGGMRIIRRNPDGSLQTISVPYRRITAGEHDAQGDTLALRAEDIVYVPISKMKTMLASGLTAGAAGAAIYALH